MSQSDHVAESLKTLVDLDFEKTSLDNVLAYLSEVVPGLNIVIDPEIELAGIGLSTRVVDLKVKAVSVETVLGLILGSDLGYRVQDGYVLVTTLEKLHQALETRTFDVRDILEDVASSEADPRAAGRILRDLVQRTVNNISDCNIAAWADEGGPASIECLTGKLVVTQTAQGFHKIEVLIAGLRENPNVTLEMSRTRAADQPPRVFVVHGWDLGAKAEVARFLEQLDLSTVVIAEQGRGMFALVESIEQNAFAADFAVVLLTPDDLGASKEDVEAAESEAKAIASLKCRARQNVVFELGYLAGVLGRGRVCALRKGSLEIFAELSDMKGIFCPEMDAAGGWKTLIAQALKDAGFEVDLNKLVK